MHACTKYNIFQRAEPLEIPEALPEKGEEQKRLEHVEHFLGECETDHKMSSFLHERQANGCLGKHSNTIEERGET
jgi:hypothetical protein